METPLQTELLAAVKSLVADEKEDKSQFHSKVFGPGGIISSAMSSAKQFMEFQQTDAYKEIIAISNKINSDLLNIANDDSNDNQTVTITVRLPKALHKSLKQEARDISFAMSKNFSINKLCVLKLSVPCNPDLLNQEGGGITT